MTLVGIQCKTLKKIPRTIEIGGSMVSIEDPLHAWSDLLHATKNTHDNCYWKLENSPWWLYSSDRPENCLRMVALLPSTLPLSTSCRSDPLLIYQNPGWIPSTPAHFPQLDITIWMFYPANAMITVPMEVPQSPLQWVGRILPDSPWLGLATPNCVLKPHTPPW
jgi:hypothetical protein